MRKSNVIVPNPNPRHEEMVTVNYFSILSLLVYRLAKEFQIFELEQLGCSLVIWQETLVLGVGAKDLHLGVVPSDKYLSTYEVQELVILAFDGVVDTLKETGEYEMCLPR
jgi:hypothetical protein